MFANNIKIKATNPLVDGIFAVIVATLLSFFLFDGQTPSSAFGADNSPSNLVSYFITWHSLAHGSLNKDEEGTDEETWRTTSEMKGSAITRFVDRSRGILSYWDTRFITVEARKNTDYWQTLHSPNGDCFIHDSRTIADTGSYSGYYNDQKRNGNAPSVLDGSTEVRNGVVTHFSLPFGGWMGMNFTEHWVNEAHSASLPNCNRAKSWESDGFPTIFPAPRDLPADSDNSHSYSLNFSSSGFDSEGIPIKVHWTARAYLMGKCAERDGPIQEGDPVIQNEDVHIDAGDAEISPDGKSKVHVKVTCDQVPIKDADVEITIKPVEESGGHYHVSKRLRGKLKGTDCGDLTNDKPCVTVKTDKDGDVIDDKHQKGLTFAPPSKIPSCRCVGLAGIYLVTAKSKRFPDRKDTVAITVRFGDLTSKLVDDTGSGAGITVDQKRNNTIVGSYYDVRSATDAHPFGTWGKLSTVSAFQDLAKEFYQLQLDHNQNLQKCGKQWPLRKVSFNDIALPWGGLFDLGPSDKNPAHPWWQPGHQTHGKGEGGDFNHFYEQGSLQECNGSDRNFDAWLWSNLKALGEKRGGIWDQYDLDNGNLWHLHMDDAGVIAPSECPKDD